MDDYKIIVEQEHTTVMAQYDVEQKLDDGTFNQAKLDELRGQHLRTPYRTI